MIVDLFAGGGGTSLGIEWALGRSPDVAVNHDPEAVAMHAANHPSTKHLCGDVWDVNPAKVCAGRPVALAWFSPDCKHFSKAKGGKPVEKGIRSLAWVVVRWARSVRPRVIILENVEEFAQWGPLGEDGRPCPMRKGLTFRRWIGSLRAAGYEVDMRELRACDFGAPTIRKRLFVIARCDGLPIVWPEATHGPGSYRSAAECIEWALPCPSIFERERPLAEATLRRIARGVRKFVLEAAEPFIVRTDMHLSNAGCVYPTSDPLRTITTAGGHALAVPSLVHLSNGERPGQAPRIYDIQAPLGTVVAQGVKQGLVTAFLAKHYGGGPTKATGSAMPDPIGTITVRDHHALVTSHMVKLFGTCQDGQPWTRPAPTVRAGGTHLGEVRAFLTRYNGTGEGQPAQLPLGTLTTRDRFGVVLVAGEAFEITDIGMRMLVPRELFRAQGFPDSYVIDPIVGKPLTKTAQIRMCGNSVVPHVAAAIVAANVGGREVVAA